MENSRNASTQVNKSCDFVNMNKTTTTEIKFKRINKIETFS